MEKQQSIENITEMNTIEEEYSLALKQIDTSHDIIAELIEECNEMVTNVKIANDLREINRRKEEKSNEKRRTCYLEEDAAKAQQQFDEINAKWDPISKYNDSIDIYNACEEQRKKCDELLNCKNNVVETLKKDLGKVNERFVDDQGAQRNDINLLALRIDKQIEMLRDTYRKHLKLIEDTIIEERNVMLDRYQAEWLRLNEKFEREEIEGMDKRSKMVEQYEKEIEYMYNEHFEKFTVTKDDLEMELQKLQIDFERLKATCRLDGKKLEYNYLVLTKREKELVQVKSEQKQKINRLRDVLLEIRQKINESEKKFQSESNKLKREISEMKIDFQRNTEKMERLTRVNENTFKKVWQLNVKRAMTLLNKIFLMDRKIHEEVLHVEWEAIEFKLMCINDLPSMQLALQQSANVELSEKGIDDDELKKKDVLPEIPTDVHLTKFILNEIVKSVEFLSQQVYKLTEDLPENQQNLVNYDYILKALKIEKQTHMELLKKFVIRFIECLTCKNENNRLLGVCKYQENLIVNKRTGSGYKRKKYVSNRPSSAPQCTNEDEKTDLLFPKIICRNPKHSWHIDKLSLINAISDFVVEMKQQKNEKTLVSSERIVVNRVLTDKDMELYWRKFDHGFPKEKNYLWDITQQSLDDYLRIAQEQATLQDEVDHLEKQNSELKQLLGKFSATISSN